MPRNRYVVQRDSEGTGYYAIYDRVRDEQIGFYCYRYDAEHRAKAINEQARKFQGSAPHSGRGTTELTNRR